MREVSFYVRLHAYMAISCNHLYFCPLTLNIFYASCKPFSFHSIVAGHFTYLKYLKSYCLVNYLIYHCVGSIFCTVFGAVTPAIPRKPQIIALQIIEHSVLFSLPKFTNYLK